MENWEIAEDMVRKMVRGRLTIGSGNKFGDGDVATKDQAWMLEVKQTAGSKMVLQARWFIKLEKFRAKKDLALVIFFDLRGYVYYRTGTGDPETWSTKTVEESNLPEKIITKSGSVWELDEINTLRELV